MLSIAAALVFAQETGVQISKTPLPNPFGKASRLLVWYEPDTRLEKPKLSPKTFGSGKTKAPFEFDFYTGGYAAVPTDRRGLEQRFEVFEQQRKANNDLGFSVTEMLLRLWEFNYFGLGRDHSAKYDRQCVDVYLCRGGTPGGEQLFDKDPSLKVGYQNVDTIYIYDLPSFTDPVEMAREVAHEYGHATLPAVGGFKTPENWGNGYLGERLFLTYLQGQLARGVLTPKDAMGATAKELEKWVKTNVYPLVEQAASAPPDINLLGGKGQKSMDAYMGLTLYCSQLLPRLTFQQVLALMTSPSARDIPDMILLAIDKAQDVPLTIPPYLIGKPVWIPVSDAQVQGATVLAKRGGWAQIKPTGTVVLVNPPR